MSIVNDEEILLKKTKLEEMRISLKTKFVGIDDVIDQLIDKIKMWWIYPMFLTRPTIINLYGMTGCGKTSLVRQLVAELGISDKYCEIELDNTKRRDFNMSAAFSISRELGESDITVKDQAVLLLDEIQRYRSINIKGYEAKQTLYDDVWRLLSDGVLSSEGEYILDLKSAIETIDSYSYKYYSEILTKPELRTMPGSTPEMLAKYAEQESEMRIRRSPDKITLNEAPINVKSITEKFEITPEEIEIMWKARLILQEPFQVFLEKNNFDPTNKKHVYKLIGGLPLSVAREYFDKKLNELRERSKINNDDNIDGFVYSKLLIFISGNIDALFHYDNDPTINDDKLYEATSNVSITDIKKELLTMFRPEHVSRFGNNYIIYKSLRKQDYVKVIHKEVDRYEKHIKDKFNIDIKLNKNEIVDNVYKMGVFPTQGIRQIYSSVSCVLGDIIPKLLIKQIADDTSL